MQSGLGQCRSPIIDTYYDRILTMTHTTDNMNDNLTTPLQSAAVISFEASKKHKLAAGNRWSRHIKKGANSTLPESCAVEVPAALSVAEYMARPHVAAAVAGYLQQLQDAQIKAAIAAGTKVLEYSELTADKLDSYLATADVAGLGQLSSERITSWFDSEARELLIVALADRLGIADTASEAEVKRLEQIANQTRDQLAKLASKKPVQFDERVRKALEWALEVTDTGDMMSSRLSERMKGATAEVDLLGSLGL